MPAIGLKQCDPASYEPCCGIARIKARHVIVDVAMPAIGLKQCDVQFSARNRYRILQVAMPAIGLKQCDVALRRPVAMPAIGLKQCDRRYTYVTVLHARQ